jgi:GNAT superfamily N-acetyltransferase
MPPVVAPPRLVAADRLDVAVLHAVLVAAFADYVTGPLVLPLTQWPDFLARQAVDLRLSRVALQGGRPVAVAFVSTRPRARRWRLATMGALPAARGSGAAKALLDDLIERAAAADMQALELEVFAQNRRALHLYEGRGFERRHPLHGWHAGPPPAAVAARASSLVAVEREVALAWLDEADEHVPELPLQMLPAVLGTVGAPLRAARRGSAQAVWVEPPHGPATLLSLVDRVPAQRDAQALMGALWAAQAVRTAPPTRPRSDPAARSAAWAVARDPLAGAVVRVPPLLRPDAGGLALARLGFERAPLYQWWMTRPL